MKRIQPSSPALVDRRHLLQGTLAAAALTALNTRGSDGQSTDAAALHKRIRQSIVYWCFHSAGEKWDVEKMCQVARRLGCASIELVSPTHWNVLKQHDLTCAIAPSGGSFKRGLNNPRYQEEVVANTRSAIDACAAAGVPSVIAFTGYKWRDADDPSSGEISAEEGADNCVAALKKLAAHAEKQGVNVCVEHLNTRDDSHPMKGHPGYQGDDLDYVAQILRRVGSGRIKLLFDIYHVQVMHGDVIRRLRENRDLLGHVHTAGCPGRGELDEQQEIFYPAIMQALLDLDYQGYVGQEFIPTRDPLAGLRQAVSLCDV